MAENKGFFYVNLFYNFSFSKKYSLDFYLSVESFFVENNMITHFTIPVQCLFIFGILFLKFLLLKIIFEQFFFRTEEGKFNFQVFEHKNAEND